MDIEKNINHVWVFFTDRCNLGCGYCFYKYRTQEQLMTLNIFQNILNYIRPVAPVEFIFSGGEPLMEAERLKEMIACIHQEKLSCYTSVQTNATLLDESLVKFFLCHGVNLEVGIDGDELTTQFNRPGTDELGYADVVNGISLAIQAGGPMTTTMVVHPSGASKLLKNLRHLATMGLRSIEIHPAFLEDWNGESSAIFLDQYRKVCAWELKEGHKGLIGRGYSESASGAWDLLVMPDGKVLGNWLLLSFPEEVRKCLYLIDFGSNSPGEFLLQAKPYFQALETHIAQNPNCSYRSISNFNALYAVQTPSGSQYQSRVNHYIDLCEGIEAVDHKIMGKGSAIRQGNSKV